ncbi:MAG: glutamate--tRNA ligase [Rhodobacteraceae bacterium]|nr:glutamate--tRNA ligase [Paracoccaceae bacterium]
MNSTPITRFAPSPTGHLHIGNVRTALFNFLIARKGGGTFILRFDDTDSRRSRQEYKDSIRRDLEWLGLTWDLEVSQSTRLIRYDEQAEQLAAGNRLYECFETPAELDLKRRLQLKRRRPPVYDRASLRLTDDERADLRARHPGYRRFLLDGSRVEWTDGIHGPVSVDSASVSDPVLVRADGRYLYTFASVVDDLDMGITHIVRGADHVTNTATQIQIMQALKGRLPSFAHHSLLTGPAGEPFSKRLGTVAIGGMRKDGIAPEVVLSHLASLGSSRSFRLAMEIDDLVEQFSLECFSANPTRYDSGDLTLLMSEYCRRLPYAQVADQIGEMGVPDRVAAQFWRTVRGNVRRISEASDWWRMFSQGAEPLIRDEDRQFVSEALELLPDPPYDEGAWKRWTEAVGKRTGRRRAALYMPLRMALTGRRTGPNMQDIMPLLQTVRRHSGSSG